MTTTVRRAPRAWRPRIAFCAPWGTRYGGAERMLEELVTQVAGDRAAVSVLAFEDGPLVDVLRAAGADAQVVATGRLRDARATARTLRTVRGLLAAAAPDVIVSWSAKTHVYSAAADRRVPRVWWQHSLADGSALDAVATRLPTAAIGCSSRRAATAQAARRPHRPTFVVHPGVRSAGPVSASERRAARGAMRLADDALVVVSLARLHPQKRLDALIAGVAACPPDLDVQLMLVGGATADLATQHPGELRELAARLGVAERVHFVGHADDVRPYLAAGDVVAGIGRAESFGISLVEGALAGLPSLATDDGGATEIVLDGETGLLVDDLGADSVAATLARFADEPWRRSAGTTAQRHAAQRWSVEAMADGILAAITDVAAGRRPARDSPTGAARQ